MLTSWKESYVQPIQLIKKQRHYFDNKGPSNQNYGFSSSLVWMWEFDYKESWVPKNWCSWTLVLRRLLRVPWTARRSFQSILKEISPKYSLKGLMLKLQILWPPHEKNWLIGKDPDAGKDWKQEEKGQKSMIWFDSSTDSMGMNSIKLWKIVKDREACHVSVHGVTKNWT